MCILGEHSVSRLAQYILGRRELLHGTSLLRMISSFVLCSTTGVPLSPLGEDNKWRHSHVGWVRAPPQHVVEISARRTAWFIRWTEEVIRASTLNTASFEVGLGRVMYVAGDIEHERPFSSSLYSFMSLIARSAFTRKPRSRPKASCTDVRTCIHCRTR